MSKKETVKKQAPARSPEARERQLISLAVDLAEKQLLEGTASSQVISHFLKLGSSREQLEQELMTKNIQNVDAKTESIQASKQSEEVYQKALEAMKEYNGDYEEDDYYD